MPKESAKATITTFTGTGLVRVVDDSAGTPLSRNMTPANLATAMSAYVAGGTDVAVADGGTGASTAAGARTNLGVVIGTDVQAYSAVLAATTASFTTADETKLDGVEALADVTDAANVAAAGAVMATSFPVEDGFACSDETTAISATGLKFRMTMRTARTITSYFACLNSACATGTFTIDVLKNDVSVLSTLITIDATETSTLTALTPAVVSTSAWAAGDVLKVSVTVVGDGTATGLKVCLIGTRSV